MNDRHTMSLIEAWLADGPEVAPDHLRLAVAGRAAGVRQASRLTWRSPAVLLPVAAALLLAAFLAGQLLRPNVGEEPDAHASSELLESWPGQPEWFVGRESLPFCGESRTRAEEDATRPDPQRLDSDGRRCLLEAFRSGRQAEFVSVVDLPDGPFLTVTRVLGPNRIEEIIDVSQRPGALEHWLVADCTRMDDPRVIAEELEGPRVSDAAAEAFVFQVDQRTCTGRNDPPEPGTVGEAFPLDPGDRPGTFMYEALWLTNVEAGQVKRVDSQTGAATAIIDVAEWLTGDAPRITMAASSATLWVAAGSSLFQIEPDGALRPMADLGGAVLGLAAEGERVWATVGRREVVAVDIDGDVLHRIALDGATALASGSGWIWAANEAGLLLQIDPATGSIGVRHDIGPDVGALAVFGDVLYGWPDRTRTIPTPDGSFQTEVDLSALRFEPATIELIRMQTTDDGYDPAVLTFFVDQLWAGYPDGRVARLDPETLALIGFVASGFDPSEVTEFLASGDGSLWVVGYSSAATTLYRVEPTR
jgi:hypothetical protein